MTIQVQSSHGQATVKTQSKLESNQKIKPVKPGQTWSNLKYISPEGCRHVKIRIFSLAKHPYALVNQLHSPIKMVAQKAESNLVSAALRAFSARGALNGQ